MRSRSFFILLACGAALNIIGWTLAALWAPAPTGPGFDAQGVPLPPTAAVGVRPAGESFDVVVNDRGLPVYLNGREWFQYWCECERRRQYQESPRFMTQEQIDALAGHPNANRPSGWNYGRGD